MKEKRVTYLFNCDDLIFDSVEAKKKKKVSKCIQK